MKPKPEDSVVLVKVPLGMSDGLLEEHQQAMSEIVGKPVLLEGYGEGGRAELRFTTVMVTFTSFTSALNTSVT